MLRSKSPYRAKPQGKNQGKRGVVTCFSFKSQRQMKRSLATVDAKAEAFTGCLTYGAEFPDASESKGHFVCFQRWVSKRFPGYGFYWKREPQKRGATHYHLLGFLPGSLEEAEQVWNKIMAKWVEIVGYSGEEKAKHLRWHLNPRNFEKVQSEKGFFHYLAKYLAKGDEPTDYDYEGGGRWWGRINKKAIPYVEKETELLDCEDTAKRQHRFLARLRESKAKQSLGRLHDRLCGLDSDTLSSWKATVLKSDLFSRIVGRPNDPAKADKLLNEFARMCFPSLRSVPKKVKRLPSTGSVTILGDPVPVLKALKRWRTGAIDKEGRARVFR